MRQQRQAQLKELEHLLAFFDENGDGMISAAELRTFLNSVGEEDVSAEEAEAMIKSMNARSDGLLPLDQLVARLEEEAATMADSVGEEAERDLREAFRVYENDGEGCITPTSLKRMLSRLGMPMEMDQCRTMICRFDINGDGVLCFDEFKFMMQMMP
ncbi:putative calcium-binding protein CML19 [Platanthera guangdongensis]|uniref:Calcium-binding protein CML19 n=1 Tax=Platanthera guangdongensis TaxID=2320717 RepID=A0ABR2MD24_9ASPA